MFRKVLIANRGEIAVRIMRACRDLGIESVAVFSDADRVSLHVLLADEAHHIGPAGSRDSYLRVDKLLEIARRSHCDAVHPGYGFLAENPALARACVEAGITFIGPSSTAMEQLGSKTAARELAHRAGVPVVPGVRHAIESFADVEQLAGEIGYPVLLKAVAGGGGKGMRMVTDAAGLPGAWRDAGSEALNAFGDARLYLERYVMHPRHIEVQIFGDNDGHIVYLNERDCSVQRRHQKVIEEAPSEFTTPELRRRMGEAAVCLAHAAGYTNAGTVEFLVDAARNFYFLEVNTRLQVEHPVTEAVTGIDLVQLQLRIAAGERLPFTQDDIDVRGHAIECRLYAEDPENNFFPSPGTILSWRTPQGPGIRCDEGVYTGYTVPGDYDPLLAKVIAWGRDRSTAIARLSRALLEFTCTGIRTNAEFIAAILTDPEFKKNQIYTRWLDDRLVSEPFEPYGRTGFASRVPDAEQHSRPHEQDEHERDSRIDAAAVAAAMWHYKNVVTEPMMAAQSAPSGWKLKSRQEQISRDPRGQ